MQHENDQRCEQRSPHSCKLIQHSPHSCKLIQHSPHSFTDLAKQFVNETGKIIGLFRGYVWGIDEDERDGSVLYSIKYEDGDTEDLNEDECLKCIELNRKLESGEIKEWEIGGDE